MKPSILFFSPSYSSGGVEKVLINLANEFCELGYVTSYLVCQDIGELKVQLHSNIETYSLNKRLSKSFFSLFWFFKNKHINVVVCGPQFLNILMLIVIKLLFKTKIQLIPTHHSFHDLDIKKTMFLSLISKRLIKFFYGFSNNIIAVSNSVKNYLVNEVGLKAENIKVIYNPTINNNFYQLAKEHFAHKWFIKNRDYKILICVGRLSKIKNQEALINLMPDLILKLKCKLLIIGTGEQNKYITELVKLKNLELYVDFLGSVSNPVKYIASSDLLILPSISETFSLVAVEAIASGVPVLSTPTLGVKEILKNCEGCYFEEIKNRGDFISKIHEIVTSKKVVDIRFTEKFKSKEIAKEYEKLINAKEYQ